MDQALVPFIDGATTGPFGFRAQMAHRIESAPTRLARRTAAAIGAIGGFIASRALTSRKRLLPAPRQIVRTSGRKTTLHPLSGFVGMAGFRRGRKGSRLTRRKGKRRMSGKAKAGVYRRASASRARRTRKKIATEADLPFSQNIEQDLSQNIIGGDTAANQLWNTISQGVGSGQRVGERVRRTGLWLNCTFFRDQLQVKEEGNFWVRVIFARQKGHGHFPTIASATGGFPAWPKGFECFTREWHREYKLVKDTKVFFGLRAGTAIAEPVSKNKTFRFKFNYPCTFDANGSDMDTGRLYMFVVLPDDPPAVAGNMKVTINQYCSYFVDELA